jgi:small subunit ribosomal protein S20
LANKKSAEKQNRQRLRREARNRARRSQMRTAIKAVRSALANKDSGKAQDLLTSAVCLIDRAGGRGLIKKNAASRLVSRLTRAVSGAA